jgi:hypothetical protein
MEYFYLYIFILLCFIIAVSYWTTINSNYIETFNSDKQSIILLGDSIFHNDAYVSDGKSVNKTLLEITNGKTISLAADHSKIVDIYHQVLKIPDNLNSSSTTIFLSAGGNDILTHYVDDNNDTTNRSILGTMFAAYKNLIKSIKNKIPDANIVLLDIYYPENLTYKQYHPIIKEWNEMIYNYASESKNNITRVLKISGILTKSDDFTLGIEPSSIGSQKLVEAIMSSY